jgi:hypothetical protein
MKISLAVSIIPLALLKNALRIVVITLLGIYVDRGFLTGQLHRNGGIVFFLLSVSLLVIELRLLQRCERWNRGEAGPLLQPSTKSGQADNRPAWALWRH